MRPFAIAGLLLACALPAAAQSDQDAVRAAVLDYVEGFYNGDSTRLVRSVSPEVYKYGYSRRGEGAYRGSRMTYPEFMSFARGVKEGRIRQPDQRPKEIVLYEVLDQTASVKLTAWWGSDYMLLAKTDGRWMITHVLWQSSPPAR